MKHIVGLKLLLLAALLVAHAGTVQAAPKVTICHAPPGNPGNAHTVRVSIHAWPAHQSHGDSLGECSPGSDTGGSGGSGGGSSDPGDDGAGDGSGGGDGFEVELCDARQGEDGRVVSVSETGQVYVRPFQCD